MAQQLPPAFQKVVNSLRANRTGLVTAYGIYYWDMLAVAPLEYRYVWKARTTPIKVFFLLNRYITLVMGFANAYLTMNHIPVDMCKKMALRLHLDNTGLRNLEQGQEDIGFTLLGAYRVHNSHDLCFDATASKAAIFDLLMWLPPLVFDSVVLTLTVYRYFDLRQRTGGIEIPILRKIAIKHVWYFGIIATTNCVNVGFFAQSDPTLKPSNAVLTITLTSIMSSRLVLSLLAPAPPPSVKRSTRNASLPTAPPTRNASLPIAPPTTLHL
ncbi:hypothetical protein JCM16303_005391 [Sporobolomyces ruberrimus]